MRRNRGRKTGGLFAVKMESLRAIRTLKALEPGEIAVTVTHRRTSAVKQFMPLPQPPDLAFEVWRLKTHARLSYGEVATMSKVAKFLAPKSRSPHPQQVRIALAKKCVRQVKNFLGTPIGRAIETSEAWRDWLPTGVDPVRLQIVPVPGYDPTADPRDNYFNFLNVRAGRRLK